MQIPHIRRHHARTRPLATPRSRRCVRHNGAQAGRAECPEPPRQSMLRVSATSLQRCAAPTQRATRTGGICFSEKIKPAHFRCSQPRSSGMVPQRRRAPGVRGSRCTGPAQIAVLFHGKLLQQGCVPADRPQRRAQRSRPRIGRRRANSAPCSQDAAGAGNGMNVSFLVLAPLFFFNVFVFHDSAGTGKQGEGRNVPSSRVTATRQTGWCHVLAPQRL